MKELEADKKQNQDCDVRHRARITDAQKKHAEELKKLHYLIFLTLNIFSLFLCKVLYYFLQNCLSFHHRLRSQSTKISKNKFK